MSFSNIIFALGLLVLLCFLFILFGAYSVYKENKFLESTDLIKCENCGTINKKARYWDYQKCEKCHSYLYDLRY